MKTTIWANCPKCQTELKIETDEPELVQIECPDCGKVFAAKVPPRSAAPVPDLFSQTPVHAPPQMPVLPPFQPAQVYHRSRPKSDGTMSPAVLTAMIVVCASAILLPLGFGGYYFYSKLSESQTAMNDAASSNPATGVSVQPSFAQTTSSESTEPTPSFKDISAQTPAGRKNPPSNEAVGSPSTTSTQPQPGAMTPTDAVSSPDDDSKIFGVPELNPPMVVQSDPPAAQATPPSNAMGTSNPTPFGNSNVSHGQVSVAGAGMSKSGLPVPLHRFVGSSGVLIFVLHSNGHSVSNAVQELQRSLSISEIHADGGGDYTTIGIRYSGSVDSVVKGIRFGQVSYVDEESRSIHVKAN